MKKLLATLLIVALLCASLFTLASCSGSSVKKFVVPDEGYDGSAVTITFYHTMGASLRKVLDDAIADFNKLYPNITIVHEQTGNYDDVRDSISTKIPVGDQPNLAYCYR